jgi:hypothetical protein
MFYARLSHVGPRKWAVVCESRRIAVINLSRGKVRVSTRGASIEELPMITAVAADVEARHHKRRRSA